MATTIRSSRRGRGLKPADVALTLDDLRDVRLDAARLVFLVRLRERACRRSQAAGGAGA